MSPEGGFGFSAMNKPKPELIAPANPKVSSVEVATAVLTRRLAETRVSQPIVRLKSNNPVGAAPKAALPGVDATAISPRQRGLKTPTGRRV